MAGCRLAAQANLQRLYWPRDRSGNNQPHTREGAVPGARRLTVEEAALIQSFPKGMKFSGSRSSQYTQVGDAVPPLLASKLGKALREQLEGYQADESSHLKSEAMLPLFDAA